MVKFTLEMLCGVGTLASSWLCSQALPLALLSTAFGASVSPGRSELRFTTRSAFTIPATCDRGTV